MKGIIDIIFLIAIIIFIVVVVINEILTSKQINLLEERIGFLEEHSAISNEIDRNILNYLLKKKNESTRND